MEKAGEDSMLFPIGWERASNPPRATRRNSQYEYPGIYQSKNNYIGAKLNTFCCDISNSMIQEELKFEFKFKITGVGVEIPTLK